MSLYSELRRRNVLRVGIVYLAGAWLLIQILETLFPIYGLAETSIQIDIPASNHQSRRLRGGLIGR